MDVLGFVTLNRIPVLPDSVRCLAKTGEHMPKEALVVTVYTPIVVIFGANPRTTERLRKLFANWIFTVSWRRLQRSLFWRLVLRFIYVK